MGSAHRFLGWPGIFCARIVRISSESNPGAYQLGRASFVPFQRQPPTTHHPQEPVFRRVRRGRTAAFFPI
jgi:hypothetical protein